MKAALVLIALGMLCAWSVSHAQVTSTRVTTFDFQCQDSAGAKISDHVRFDTAFVACLNAPDGVYVQGGRYRITKTVVVTPPATTGSAPLSWTTPTKNVDGSTLVDLAGYRIVYGQSATALTGSIQLGKVNAYTVTGLSPGQWYFAIIALTPTAQSAQSNVASKAIS